MVKEQSRWLTVQLNQTGLRVLAAVLVIPIFIILYTYNPTNSIYPLLIISYGLFYILFLFTLTWKKRRNKNYWAYYLFHLSKISGFIIILAFFFLAFLFIKVECDNYNLDINEVCISKIKSEWNWLFDLNFYKSIF
ncbi:hypothetical protein COV24_01180 [candidate division WWE3 bacterium CG10_big_fil_rev_8_21_14_0_10_32_10]|uniref:Uncharacterized protein n=1 Tax=candidate division WWE3 bacterium CG10_big_fil_rev_8_21_14_0_10_32_10 TaxID=1975090 RepID=A0A2H0RBA9_UNCKA|nr:MAG: hypothetical protein COV24_01180 [candidate division WWE3 bacterium CG10_big_fil_rev_8_21_14_0_10_32_10]